MTGLKKLLAMIASGKKVQTIGGLPVLIDNYRYSIGDGMANDSGTVDVDYFIAGWFDSESTESKQYRFAPDAKADYLVARWFNDITAQSVDYWRPNKASEKTLTAPGRFIAVTVYKPTASNYYLYDNTNKRYIFKGENVT